ncbi:unnamed protein product, partial [Ectocarpus fasciculatus]
AEDVLRPFLHFGRRPSHGKPGLGHQPIRFRESAQDHQVPRHGVERDLDRLLARREVACVLKLVAVRPSMQHQRVRR